MIYRMDHHGAELRAIALQCEFEWLGEKREREVSWGCGSGFEDKTKTQGLSSNVLETCMLFFLQSCLQSPCSVFEDCGVKG